MFFPSCFRFPLFIAAAMAAWSITSAAPSPDWWSQRELTNGQSADDFAVANVGQLKYVAAKAVVELDAHLPGGAGTELQDLIDEWEEDPSPGTVRDDYSVLNQGQLKYVVKKIYDRLRAAGWHDLPLAYNRIYPWTSSTADDDSYAIVNLGQLKYVFSFNVKATRAVALFSSALFTTGTQITLRARITVPDGIEIASITLNGQPVSRALLQDGILTVTVDVASGLNSFTLVVTDVQGHSYYGNAQATRVTGTISQFSIGQPAAGATIPAPSVDVGGIWGEAVPLRSLTVNGYPAFFAGTQWSAQAIPLEAGANTLTVVATDEAGRTATLTRSVTSSHNPGAPSPLTLTANITSGAAPLTVTFTPQLNVTGTVQKADYYFYGRSQAAVSGTTLAPVAHTFSEPGDYYPTVTVLLANGVTYSSGGIATPVAQRLHIHVSGPGDGEPLAVWAAFGAALTAQDAAAASSYLDAGQVQKWRDFIARVGITRISRMHADLTNFKETVDFGDIKQFHAPVDTLFGRAQFPIDFIKEDGVWKIKGF